MLVKAFAFLIQINMAILKTVRGKTPKIGNNVFLAENAVIIGDVTIGDNCSIWYNVTIRGDVAPISIGNETNIQDGSVIHGTFNKAAASIGNRVTVGHGVILHGCQIGDKVLIGMGALVMDNAKVSDKVFIGAGSLVPENFKCESGQLYLGRPAAAKRNLKDSELSFLDQSADNYLLYKTWYE